ncbi:hypothetical protein GWI34_34570 [Actinomadura sp. DSM 109109]|nr:hypothetical protein [Actinomadura lepetitiana]
MGVRGRATGPSAVPPEIEVVMDSQREPESRPAPPDARPLLSTRTLLIILTACIAAGAVALKPAAAVPLGVGIAVVTLLMKILDD